MANAPQTVGVSKKLLHVAQNLGLAPIPTTHHSYTSKMGAAECQARRQLLQLTQAEAAQWLSTPPVSERAWQYWESGKRTIPQDVAEALTAACERREAEISEALNELTALKSNPKGALWQLVGVWYAKADDWKWTLKPHSLEWKLHNSVLSALASKGQVKLVGFDEKSYAEWSQKLPHAHSSGEMKRHGQWAVETLDQVSGG